MLAGQGIHSLQEAGTVSIHYTPSRISIPLLGIYPTWETLLAQIFILVSFVLIPLGGQLKNAASLQEYYRHLCPLNCSGSQYDQIQQRPILRSSH